MRRVIQILPGTGRGTARSAVEGACEQRPTQSAAPSTPGCAGGPPPRKAERI
jgi:hypothetical protein